MDGRPVPRRRRAVKPSDCVPRRVLGHRCAVLQLCMILPQLAEVKYDRFLGTRAGMRHSLASRPRRSPDQEQSRAPGDCRETLRAAPPSSPLLTSRYVEKLIVRTGSLMER